MPDILHFDPEDALRKVMLAFWENGYRSMTTKALAECAGVSESSLFNTFGNKRRLYELALERYRTGGGPISRLFRSDASPLGILREYLELLGEHAIAPRFGAGCMITNAAVEQADDAEISAWVAAAHRDEAERLRTLLERAIDEGELERGTDAEGLAEFLLASAQGIRLLARTRPSRARIQSVIEANWKALEAYRPKESAS